jgi:hypothetical protein
MSGRSDQPVAIDIPRSLMFMTPVALELVLFFAGTCLSSFGDVEIPLTAESTLEISCASAAIAVVYERRVRSGCRGSKCMLGVIVSRVL